MPHVFLPLGRGIKNYQLTVYDRWGAMVFESSDLFEGWDGSYKGEASMMGVYAWQIRLVSENGKQTQLEGHVELLK